MRIEKLKDNPEAKRLILVFSGWAASPQLFQHLTAESLTNIWICYDYRELLFNESLERFDEIHLVAWSLGVWVAAYLMQDIIPAKTNGKRWTTTAINGTESPIDDEKGIPEAIFRGTLEHLDEKGLSKFIRRMCDSKELSAIYQQLPPRPLSELQEELQTLYDTIQKQGAIESFTWSNIWLSRKDRIFPISNLRHYWQGHPCIRETDTSHIPFFQWDKWETLWI